MRSKDGHNCGGFSELVSDVSEETVTHHGQNTKLVIEQILAEFKTRVDPEDFLQYLTGLNEEDEVYMINLSLNRLHLPKLKFFCDVFFRDTEPSKSLIVLKPSNKLPVAVQYKQNLTRRENFGKIKINYCKNFKNHKFTQYKVPD